MPLVPAWARTVRFISTHHPPLLPGRMARAHFLASLSEKVMGSGHCKAGSNDIPTKLRHVPLHALSCSLTSNAEDTLGNQNQGDGGATDGKNMGHSELLPPTHTPDCNVSEKHTSVVEHTESSGVES